MILPALASTMAETPVPVSVGMTATAWIAIGQTIIQTLLGGGVLYGVARAVALVWKTYIESKKQDNDAAAAVRREMMDLNDRQTARIAALELDLREERKQHDEELAKVRKDHVAEVSDIRRQHTEEMGVLNRRIEALHNQMVQMQQSTGRAIKNGVNAPATASRVTGPDVEGIGAALRDTFTIPGTGDKV